MEGQHREVERGGPNILSLGLKAFNHSIERLSMFHRGQDLQRGFYKKEHTTKRLTADALNKYLDKSPEFVELFTLLDKYSESSRDIHSWVLEVMGTIFTCLKTTGLNKERSANVQSVSK